MEYPPNPTQQFRVASLVPALIPLLVLAILQPLVVVTATILPLKLGDSTWRFQAFTMILGAAPQISVGLVLVAAIGLFGERFRAVRGAALGAILLAIVLLPLLFLDALDYLEVRRLVGSDKIRTFDVNVLQAVGVGIILVPLLLWFGGRGLQAGKKVPGRDVEDQIVIDKDLPQ